MRGLAVLLLVAATWAQADEPRAVTPLPHAHAHNDYAHPRPLLDALDHGFCSVEADVYLRDERLLVGHMPLELKPDRTLEKLYLEPLRQRLRAHGGKVYQDGPRFYLLIDIKSEANATYVALDRTLAHYADIASTVRNGKLEEKAVTVVISGNRPREFMAAQKTRYAGMDGRLADLDTTEPAHLIPWISDRWSGHFRWKGQGPMPETERDRLKAIVEKAHARGRLIRFWDTPEDPGFWKELRACGVDLINTDKLAELERFLTAP